MASKQEVQEFYKRVVENEGLVATLDNDGDVTFKIEKMGYFISIDEEDSGYMRMALPNFWSLENDADRERAWRVCCEVTAKVKCVKVYVVRDNVWAGVEMLLGESGKLPDGNILSANFSRLTKSIRHAAMTFAQSMREDPEVPDSA